MLECIIVVICSILTSLHVISVLLLFLHSVVRILICVSVVGFDD